MGAEDRPDPGALDLIAEIERTPWRFHLFTALRRLERAHPNHARLGEGLHPWEEPIRIAQEATLAFSPHPIASVDRDPNGVPRLRTDFFGLLGPNGALPFHITDYVRDRTRNAKDPTFARFLDIFHHRMISLFYRAFANAEPVVARDRPGADGFMKYVGALVGLGLPATRGRDAVDDRAKLFFAGRLAPQPRNADGLVAMIEEYLGIPCALEQYVGEWVDLPVEWRWCLGGSGLDGELGRSTSLGPRAWLCQGKFRVVLGPIESGQLEDCLPGGDILDALSSLIRGYVGDALAWELRLALGETAVEPWRLGGALPLGRTCWLGSPPKRIDVPLPRDTDAPNGSKT